MLEEAGALDALRDPLIEAATREIITPPGAPRYDVQREIKQKERAIDYISNKYQNANINAEGIKLCLYSIGDNNNYLACNRDPVDKMIGWLTSGWSEEEPSEEYVLGELPSLVVNLQDPDTTCRSRTVKAALACRIATPPNTTTCCSRSLCGATCATVAPSVRWLVSPQFRY